MMSKKLSIFEDKQLFELVVEASPAGMVIADSKGTIVYVNPQAQSWLGYTEDELLGEPVEILVPESHSSAHTGHRARYVEHPKSRPMAEARDLYARRKDGSQFPVDISLHPFDTHHGRFILANMLDATQRKQAERVPQERIAAIGEMCAGLAHESRNALQRARGCLDLLELDFEDQAEQKDLTKRIRRSLDDLEHVYEEVRNYASPIVLDQADVDFQHLIRETFDDLQYEFGSQAFKLGLQIDEPVRRNRADRPRLKQVLRNILENAMQASDRGSTIQTTVTPVELEGKKWQQIEVTDTGSGLTDETRQRMFEPFYTTKQKGTGLGLAICQRIVEAHAGKITAASATGQGTSLRILLPMHSTTS